jgi:endothelin-converting enzyme/putative endopeptidase
MDDLTRNKAREKFSRMIDFIGYPDNWTDFSSVNVYPNEFFQSSIEALKFSSKIQWDHLKSKTNRFLWKMNAAAVNAFYSMDFNTINFPAGILQPELFREDYPHYVNFARIGMVIGHEISQWAF